MHGHNRPMPAAPLIWDVFCRVIDNHGDLGVCWRLARELAARGHGVRLWVDDAGALAWMAPGALQGACPGVQVLPWGEPFDAGALGGLTRSDVWIEAFGCELPKAFVAHGVRAGTAPVWINLEYLSAEDWVGGCHGLPSPHPSLPLRKHFFFPGFRDNTGGVLGEADVSARREAQLADPAAGWAALGLTPPLAGELTVSLFCYGGERVDAWLDALLAHGEPVRVLVPDGRGAAEAAHWCGQWLAPGWQGQRGAVRVQGLPFVEQREYDRLLWLCDLNLVRGEDSFVRAQWAARPFVWHIYPQDDCAHLDKLRAFLALYAAELPAASAAALTDFWLAWNHGVGIEPAWRALLAERAALAEHARRWAAQLAQRDTLAVNLARFCESLL